MAQGQRRVYDSRHFRAGAKMARIQRIICCWVHFSFMFSILFFPRIAIASFRPFALGWGVNKRTLVSIAASPGTAFPSIGKPPLSLQSPRDLNRVRLPKIRRAYMLRIASIVSVIYVVSFFKKCGAFWPKIAPYFEHKIFFCKCGRYKQKKKKNQQWNSNPGSHPCVAALYPLLQFALLVKGTQNSVQIKKCSKNFAS